MSDPAHTSHLAVRAARNARRTASYDTRVPTGDVTERFPLLDLLEHGYLCRGLELEVEDQGQCEGGQAETPATDAQR